MTDFAETLWSQLAAGDISLQDVDPTAFGLYTLGYNDGRASLAGEINRLEHECDRLYTLAQDPKQPQRITAQLLEQEQVLRVRRGAA